jgi:predicted Zn finger-like uncharacterized protein
MHTCIRYINVPAYCLLYSIPISHDDNYVSLREELELSYQHVTRRYTCPHCRATYSYPDSSLDIDGSVVCQNCGRPISSRGGPILEGEAVTIQEPVQPVRRMAGTRVTCPYCCSTYIYRDENQMQSGMVRCQNCNREIEARGEGVVVVEEPNRPVAHTDNVPLAVAIIFILLFVPLLIAIGATGFILLLRFRQSISTRLERNEGAGIN